MLVSDDLYTLSFVDKRFFREPRLLPIVVVALSFMLSWNNFHCSTKSPTCSDAYLLLVSKRKLFATFGSFNFSITNGGADVTTFVFLSLSRLQLYVIKTFNLLSQ